MRSYLIFLIFFFLSCSQPTPPPKVTHTISWGSELKQVMLVHDEVMPFITEINNLNKTLKTYQSEHPNISKDQKKRLQDVQEQLTKADESMWDWMHGFVQPNENDDPKKASIYLANEQKKINMVSQKMKSSMAAAKKLIAELKI